ncbi:MAG: DUF2817 domain-containing protein, partial [Acidimicrobiales bacterium]|nr:DUF2817 domain-containing protein [Acidimicrobiales bacterium]
MGPSKSGTRRRGRAALWAGLLSAGSLASPDAVGRPAAAGTVPAGPVLIGMAQPATFVIGESVQGRPIVAHRRQGAAPTNHLVVIGVIHGDETAGQAVVDALLTAPLPDDLQLTVLPTVNPDGEAAHRRTNANGVDLNRNFPHGWLPEGASEFTVGDYNPGPAPLSEPEAVAVHRWLDATRPDFTVWYHQPWDVVVCDEGAEPLCVPLAGRLAMTAEGAPRPGSAATWGSANGLPAAVVELPEEGIDDDGVARHVAALLDAFEPWA